MQGHGWCCFGKQRTRCCPWQFASLWRTTSVALGRRFAGRALASFCTRNRFRDRAAPNLDAHNNKIKIHRNQIRFVQKSFGGATDVTASRRFLSWLPAHWPWRRQMRKIWKPISPIFNTYLTMVLFSIWCWLSRHVRTSGFMCSFLAVPATYHVPCGCPVKSNRNDMNYGSHRRLYYCLGLRVAGELLKPCLHGNLSRNAHGSPESVHTFPWVVSSGFNTGPFVAGVFRICSQIVYKLLISFPRFGDTPANIS